MIKKLTRATLKTIILEERRAVTRALIAEGGCGCGMCSTCRSSLSSMSGIESHDEPANSMIISYDDEGMPSSHNYMDHATANATHAYPYEDDTGGDIVHGHDFGQSYMAKQQLHTIMKMAQKLDGMIEGDEELEDWCESKLAVATSMLQSVTEFVSYHKAASHPDAESHPADHGMGSLMRILREE